VHMFSSSKNFSEAKAIYMHLLLLICATAIILELGRSAGQSAPVSSSYRTTAGFDSIIVINSPLEKQRGSIMRCYLESVRVISGSVILG